MDAGTVIPIALPLGFMIIPALVAYAFAKDVRRKKHIMRHGLTAPGQCLRRRQRTVSSGGSSSREVWHDFGFTDARGQWVQFREQANMSVKEGTPVTVHYLPEDPAGSATTDRSGLRGSQALVVVLSCVSMAAAVVLVVTLLL
ncbi:DUF3592 domain-containing protein [Streptomyces sp. A7024]|uniref:DUF3592 domain-containing protein n=1 Tax=Streptomyces coryli TaxID=1128680 RepID=A0A6G4U6A7_9ACTN|nr:DUF3592 domain-containing protein [Streptomyces coryli]NGN67270.1 DUF3592 domain-containing protein [Streptomyces coryli]